ncbi:DUF2061 domain-containing protein [Autumnicola psychrophila]|uniref:DUF2061 domain-containing protein n=1 Tax=Autumnicola psychrophila TaxID=3075592 RepID=A0ABU3DNI8_9FLAO|nr:DUF2061 domain-containing protein [Zunongwangia sp. F225]MDT0685277.1 DUF2061 domain-containing protein [Zunongwangia sp. F225]
MGDTPHKRHIAKAITWRVVGTIDTILLSWFISGNPLVALQIGMAEVITKMGLYYCHERIWFRLDLKGEAKKSHFRHFLKSISWRVVGTVDTMFLAWVITGNALTGLKIGLVEVITKMTLYYLHERAWYKINYGLNGRKFNSKSISHE